MWCYQLVGFPFKYWKQWNRAGFIPVFFIFTDLESLQGVDIGAYEESLFLNIADLRDSTTTGAKTTDVPDIADDKTVRLNGSDANRIIGTAKVFAVSAGDQIDVTVDGYYTGTYSNSGAQT